MRLCLPASVRLNSRAVIYVLQAGMLLYECLSDLCFFYLHVVEAMGVCVLACALLSVYPYFTVAESSATMCERQSHVSLCCCCTHLMSNLADSVRFDMPRYDTGHYTHTEASARSTPHAC